jgi:hypothetical protein
VKSASSKGTLQAFSLVSDFGGLVLFVLAGPSDQCFSSCWTRNTISFHPGLVSLVLIGLVVSRHDGFVVLQCISLMDPCFFKSSFSWVTLMLRVLLDWGSRQKFLGFLVGY